MAPTDVRQGNSQRRQLVHGVSSSASINKGLKYFGNHSFVKAYHRRVRGGLVGELQVVARSIVSNIDAQYGCAERTYQLWSLIRNRITVMLASGNAAVVQDCAGGVLPAFDIAGRKDAANKRSRRPCNNRYSSLIRLGGCYAHGHVDATRHVAVQDHTFSLLRRTLGRHGAETNEYEHHGCNYISRCKHLTPPCPVDESHGSG